MPPHARIPPSDDSARTRDPGLFGPASITWRVHADPMMLVGGVRALFLQALHPRAMVAVSGHSRFRADPWGRLMRTAEYIATTTYGTTTQAQAAAARIRDLHATVPGAGDPELVRWIHCCEIDSFLSAVRRGGLPLTDAECDRYILEQARTARLVGLEPSGIPLDIAALRDYFETMRPSLSVTPQAREAVRYLLLPPMPLWVAALTPARGAWAATAGVAFGLLPAWARRMYRMPGLPTTDLAATAAARAMRRSLMLVPESLRTGPQVRAAKARLAS
jgi:uncharacterized protein (DUF2236 family)